MVLGGTAAGGAATGLEPVVAGAVAAGAVVAVGLGFTTVESVSGAEAQATQTKDTSGSRPVPSNL